MMHAVIHMMGGYDPDAVKWFNQLSTPATKDLKDDFNQLIKDLKGIGEVGTNNNYQYIDRGWLAGGVEAEDQALVSIFNPTSTAASPVNSPTWATGGYSGNGTSQYINFNFNPATQAVHFTRNSAFSACYVRSNVSGNGNVYGLWNGGGIFTCSLAPRLATNNVAASVNQSPASITQYANSDARGFYISRRTTVNDRDEWKNDTQKLTYTQTSEIVQSGNIYGLARNRVNPITGAPVPENYTTAQVAGWFFGGGQIAPASFFNAFQNFYTRRGIAIP